MTSAEIIDAVVKVLIAAFGAAGFWQLLQGSRERKTPKADAAREVSAEEQSAGNAGATAASTAVATPESLMLLSRQELREDYAECRKSLTGIRVAAERILQRLDEWRSRAVVADGGGITITLDAEELDEIRRRSNDLRSHLN